MRGLVTPVRPELVEGYAERLSRLPPSRSMAARGQSLFAVAQKVTKNASPCTPLHPAVLAHLRKTGRAALDIARTRRLRVANSAMQCRYDRPLLRSSARAEGAFEPMFDRFAMRTTRDASIRATLR